MAPPRSPTCRTAPACPGRPPTASSPRSSTTASCAATARAATSSASAWFALGRAAADAFPLADLARPVLVDLRDRTGESVQLFVREGAGRRCLVSLQSAHGLRWIVPEGVVLPLHVGSAGRLLSGEAGPDGWVASVEERESGVASVSAPVVDDQGDIVAAVSVSGPLGRMTRQPGRRFGAEVAAAAEQVSAAITPRSGGAAAQPRPAAAGR